ncbi:MAG: DUF962 domain-containing protein [Candidatus Dormibacteraeota bacterium]|nr:DUF962 domain-containing protein [Candidatus Dormibacteraeota bacterium]MBV9526185.1 DUF962 domain-containing protein [Candidatus Dormibacteraeota bacterium]
MREFSTFDDFFPYYVSQHSKPATRWFHFAGTHLGAAVGITGIVRRKPALLAAAPVISYGLAWFSHFTIEGNKPATFGHPVWSFIGDLKMLGYMWRGRDAELTRIADSAKQLTVREGAAA